MRPWVDGPGPQRPSPSQLLSVGRCVNVDLVQLWPLTSLKSD